jgi:hypothetical protein
VHDVALVLSICRGLGVKTQNRAFYFGRRRIVVQRPRVNVLLEFIEKVKFIIEKANANNWHISDYEYPL